MTWENAHIFNLIQTTLQLIQSKYNTTQTTFVLNIKTARCSVQDTIISLFSFYHLPLIISQPWAYEFILWWGTSVLNHRDVIHFSQSAAINQLVQQICSLKMDCITVFLLCGIIFACSDSQWKKEATASIFKSWLRWCSLKTADIMLPVTALQIETERAKWNVTWCVAAIMRLHIDICWMVLLFFFHFFFVCLCVYVMSDPEALLFLHIFVFLLPANTNIN